MIPLRTILVLFLVAVVALACQRDSHPVDRAADEIAYRGYEDEDRFLEPYEQYLRAQGRYTHAERIDSLLRAERYPRGVPSIRDSIDLREKAYHLAMDGITASYLLSLRESEMDVLSMDWRQQRIGQAATSEIVVRATVANQFTDRTVDDEFRSTVVLDVEEVIKGPLPVHEGSGDVLIRRRSGETRQGRYVNKRSELDLEEGATYLMFLSRSLYEFHVQYPDLMWLLSAENPYLFRYGRVLPDVPDTYVLERYPALRLDWLPDSRRDEVLASLAPLRVQ